MHSVVLLGDIHSISLHPHYVSLETIRNRRMWRNVNEYCVVCNYVVVELL